MPIFATHFTTLVGKCWGWGGGDNEETGQSGGRVCKGGGIDGEWIAKDWIKLKAHLSRGELMYHIQLDIYHFQIKGKIVDKNTLGCIMHIINYILNLYHIKVNNSSFIIKG